MGILDSQLGVKIETTYGAPVTPDRFFEYDSETLEAAYGRVEGEPLRSGQRAQRSDRFTPYRLGAAGDLTMAVLSKGFGWWLRPMLGTTATSGPVDSVYTHTGTVGDLTGDMFTAQLNRPLNPSGSDQQFTYHGCKVAKWSLRNSVEGNLLLIPTIDAEDEDVTTSLASASYPTGMENLTWVGGAITLGGTSVAVTEIGIDCDNKLNTGRRLIRGSDLKKEQTEAGMRDLSASLEMEFESLAQRAYVASLTRAGTLAELICTWTAPTLAGVSTYPHFKVTVPALRLDSFKANVEGPGGLKQALAGKGRYDGTNSLVTVEVKNTDATA